MTSTEPYYPQLDRFFVDVITEASHRGITREPLIGLRIDPGRYTLERCQRDVAAVQATLNLRYTNALITQLLAVTRERHGNRVRQDTDVIITGSMDYYRDAGDRRNLVHSVDARMVGRTLVVASMETDRPLIGRLQWHCMAGKIYQRKGHRLLVAYPYANFQVAAESYLL